MAIAGFFRSYMFGPSGFWTMAPLSYAAKLDPFPSFRWIAPPTPSTLAQSKERKGSNFAIWLPCPSSLTHHCLVGGLELEEAADVEGDGEDDEAGDGVDARVGSRLRQRVAHADVPLDRHRQRRVYRSCIIN